MQACNKQVMINSDNRSHQIENSLILIRNKLRLVVLKRMWIYLVIVESLGKNVFAAKDNENLKSVDSYSGLKE